MKKINRAMLNICSVDLDKSKSSYTQLFDFVVNYDSDWFVHLVSKDQKVELGLINKNHELVPKTYRNVPSGCYITFVIDDVDTLFEATKAKEIEVVEEPIDTFYGQRRLLIKDPDGTLIDASAPIADFEWKPQVQ